MITVAVVQAGTVFASQDETLAKLRELAHECKRRDASLAVFPEAFIGGYPKGLSFGVSAGIRTDEGRRMFHGYADGAVSIPGPVVDEIGEIAKETELYLVVGVIERAGGTLYCSVIYVGPDGALLGKHRKLMPTAFERVIWGSGDASTLKIVDSRIGKLGALICWENYMPLARMAMYEQGVELYCTPTVDDRETWIPTVRHIAREGRCYVLSSCQVLARNAYPKEWISPELPASDPLIRGGSCIVDPLGKVLAGPLYGEEGIVVCAVEIERLMEAKFDFDVVGHYARPDVFQFTWRSP